MDISSLKKYPVLFPSFEVHQSLTNYEYYEMVSFCCLKLIVYLRYEIQRGKHGLYFRYFTKVSDMRRERQVEQTHAFKNQKSRYLLNDSKARCKERNDEKEFKFHVMYLDLRVDKPL